MSNPATKLHFARFEFKYILPRTRQEAFEKELLYFVQLDPFVEKQRGNRYFVRSLYFDDPVYSAYYDKIDGLHTRSKFRLRTYASEPTADVPVFLEIKGRHNNLVFKHRAPVDGPAMRDASGDELVRKIVAGGDADVLNHFRFDVERKRIRPVVCVDYARRPYVSKFDPEFRLTFDSHLRARPAGGLFSSRGPERVIKPGYVVMEVKFRYRIPSWFHRLLQSFELRRVSISKVCRGLEACEMVTELQ